MLVVVTLRPNELPHLLLVSHLDTVPAGEGWRSDPFKLQRDGEKLTGLGANDAKGCVAAMILAAALAIPAPAQNQVPFKGSMQAHDIDKGGNIDLRHRADAATPPPVLDAANMRHHQRAAFSSSWRERMAENSSAKLSMRPV